MSKVWFVTGASSGIGAGVVTAALEAGGRVVVFGDLAVEGYDASIPSLWL
jgi:NAD(P)-dependent dehydrogenase (short-subunit alcohol dehydrogenase family)